MEWKETNTRPAISPYWKTHPRSGCHESTSFGLWSDLGIVINCAEYDFDGYREITPESKQLKRYKNNKHFFCGMFNIIFITKGTCQTLKSPGHCKAVSTVMRFLVWRDCKHKKVCTVPWIIWSSPTTNWWFKNLFEHELKFAPLQVNNSASWQNKYREFLLYPTHQNSPKSPPCLALAPTCLYACRVDSELNLSSLKYSTSWAQIASPLL